MYERPPEPFRQVPARVNARFVPGIERSLFAPLVFQATLHQLARLRIQHRDLLVARMQVTPYNLHVLGSFPPSLGCLSAPSLLGALGADTVI